MTRQAWLIPLDPAPGALGMTQSILEDSGVRYTVVEPERVREQLDEVVPPASIVHGGVLTPQLFDVQRWLAEFRVPALVLVERLTDHYEASLLDRGARDVVAIPASPRKLRSRVEALVRPQDDAPPRPVLPRAVAVGDRVEIQPHQRTISVDGRYVTLTKTEFDLLLALALNQGDVLTRSALAAAAGKPHLSDRALESHISRIRTKLRAARAPDFIDSVRSVGYRLQVAQ